MIMTFDWLPHAQVDRAWKTEIENALESEVKIVLTHMKMFRIVFDPDTQVATVCPFSEISDFYYKTKSAKITYSAVKRLLHGDFESIVQGDITYLD